MNYHNHHHVHADEKLAHRDAHAGHDKHAGHSVAMFRNRFWLTLLLTIPTIFWSIGALLAAGGSSRPRWALRSACPSSG